MFVGQESDRRLTVVACGLGAACVRVCVDKEQGASTPPADASSPRLLPISNHTDLLGSAVKQFPPVTKQTFAEAPYGIAIRPNTN